MLAVSRAVAGGGALSEVLDCVAAEATTVVGARSASILLLRGRNRFELAGSFGLSRGYQAMLESAPVQVEWGRGPSGLAVERGELVVFADTLRDPRFDPWRPLAEREGYRGLVSVPLSAGGHTLGALNAYWDRPGPWPHHLLKLLAFFGEGAANAIRTTQLIERRERQIGALSRLVRGLREQTHEHANRIHAISGLLALGEHEDAARFVASVESMYHETYGSIEERVQVSALAGLILAEATIARQRGLTLELDESSRVTRLPDLIDELDAVTVVGNLIGNAFDAVAELPSERRRVLVTVRDEERELIIRVRDFGTGIAPSERAHILERGYTTKEGHVGMGLALVGDIVTAALGEVEVEQLEDGTAFCVRIPVSVPARLPQ